MPLIYLARVSGDREEFFFAERPTTVSQSQDVVSTPTNEGESSSSSDFRSRYQKLPSCSKSCLDYCSFVTFKYPVDEEKLVRLLLAVEGLVPQIPGKLMEEVAEMIIDNLIFLQMLICPSWYSAELQVDDNYKELCLHQVEEKEFFDMAADSPVFALLYDDGKGIPPNFQGLHVHSLFVMTLKLQTGRTKNQGLSRAFMETICQLQSLAVLDLQGIVECLPEGIGNMVHLRYLGLYWSELNEFPPSLSNLEELLTLDIRYCRLHELPVEVLKMKQLRHLLMCHNHNDGEITVAKGFGTMTNLRTCDGVYGGGGIAKELGNLIQLRRLRVNRVTHDHSDELAAAIMKMTNLKFLSLEAEGPRRLFEGTLFPEMEQFSPPPLLQELTMSGGLVDVPSWFFSIENLTALHLCCSRLLENQISVLQCLPKLKLLGLTNACAAKYMGKGFCNAGGFKELHTLKISSRTLVEWGEIVEGAFPSLEVLIFLNCMKLKFLPDGLQYVSTLKQLCIRPVYNDIAKRLIGEENYKIKHIEYFVFRQL